MPEYVFQYVFLTDDNSGLTALALLNAMLASFGRLVAPAFKLFELDQTLP